jgi:NAD(P)-dependent dehydrogenase (short-subunit alcohol dehydrogenase family)
MPDSQTNVRQSAKNPRDAGPKPPQPAQEQAPTGKESRMDPQPDYGFTSYRGHGRLKDKVALVTGGDSGIGRAVALAFAREGADVVIGYLENEDDARESAEVVESAGRRAITVAADIGSDDQAQALIAEAVRKFGRIDILVNNAAKQGKSVERFEELDAERVEATFRTNIMSMFHLVRHALPHMRAGSAIINVASIQAYNPSAQILDYATTKGAIVTFSKGLAQSLIERGIRVNCVAPGPVWTPLVVQSFDAEKNAEFGKDSPMGRPAQPAELAPAFVFLASDEASYVNGEVLGVTGGKPLG